MRLIVLANFAGSAWTALIAIAFVPVYVRLLGVEAYALVGIFTALQATLAVLDLGLSQAMTREIATLGVSSGRVSLMRDTARTLEALYWVVGLAIALLVIAASGFIAFQWLNPVGVSRDVLQGAVEIMAVVLGLRWPIAIYNGALLGLQRQVLLNSMQIGFATVQSVGAALVLTFVEPSPRAFFAWIGMVSLAQVLAMRALTWRGIPGSSRAAFRWEIVSRIKSFAAGMTAISVLATILTQLDKILLSRLLSLSEFGYYTFAVTVASAIIRFAGPVFNAYYPRMTALVAEDAQALLRVSFTQATAVLALVVLPAAITLALYSREVLTLWTSDAELVAGSQVTVSLLVLGYALNGLMHGPYALQLAHGWTRLAVISNAIAVTVLAPSIVLATNRWGAVGAAGVFLLLNLGYLAFNASYMFSRLLPALRRDWYRDAVFLPISACLIVALLVRWMMPVEPGGLVAFVKVCLVFIVSCVAVVAVSPTLRANASLLVRAAGR